MQMVLVGAGHAHLEALRGLAGRGGLPAGTRPTIMTHGRHTTYSGMPPGVIAGSTEGASWRASHGCRRKRSTDEAARGPSLPPPSRFGRLVPHGLADASTHW
jgi:hypothetical protein